MNARTTILLLALAMLASVANTQGRPSEGRPNIILIVADDLGYGEVGAYGQEWIRTPHIDRLASEGMRFTQHYSGNAVCAPSRCSLMTGMHQGHAYIRDNGNPPERKGKGKAADGYFPGQNPIPDEELTIAEVLKGRGYRTGACGKWGLGFEGSSGDPNRQGFDLFYGFLCQVHAHNHYPRFLWKNGEKEVLEGNDRTLEGAVYSQDRFIEEALAFIRDGDDEPFFLYLPFAIPHLAIQAPQESLDEYTGVIPEEEYEHRGYIKHPHPRAGYAAMVTHMDRGIGEVLALLEELSIDDDTIVIFTSDNGPTYDRLGGSDSEFFESAAGFRGFKGSLYEGGIRVPLVARWPGRIEAGRVSNHMSAFWDYFPTLCELAGAEIPAGLDGISFAPTLLGEGEQREHEHLYWEFRAYGGQQAVRTERWKAIRQSMRKGDWTTELYDLENDPAESEDVAAEHPEVLARLEAILAAEHTPSELFRHPIDG